MDPTLSFFKNNGLSMVSRSLMPDERPGEGLFEPSEPELTLNQSLMHSLVPHSSCFTVHTNVKPQSTYNSLS